MTWYKAGTVTVTAGSTTVTGASTRFVENLMVGDIFYGPDSRLYEITNIASNTALALSPAYQGATAAGQAYSVIYTQARNKRLADRAAALLDDLPEQVEDALQRAEVIASANHRSLILTPATVVSVDTQLATFFHLTLDRARTKIVFLGDSQTDHFRQFTLVLKQGTGSNLVDWPDNVRWSFGNEPALSFTPSCEDVITFMQFGGSPALYGFFNGGGIHA